MRLFLRRLPHRFTHSPSESRTERRLSGIVFRMAPDIESERDRALGGSTGRLLSDPPDGYTVLSGMGPHHGPATGSVARGRYDCRHCTCPSFDCCDQETNEILGTLMCGFSTLSRLANPRPEGRNL